MLEWTLHKEDLGHSLNLEGADALEQVRPSEVVQNLGGGVLPFDISLSLKFSFHSTLLGLFAAFDF